MDTPAAAAKTNSTETSTQQPPVTAAKPEQAPNTPAPSTTAKVTPITEAKPSPAPVKPEPVVLSRDQRIMQELELRFIQIKELADTSYFSHEGVCRKCGWHTMEHTAESAASLMSAHVVRHWKDVASQIK